jgi:hypothetical protein
LLIAALAGCAGGNSSPAFAQIVAAEDGMEQRQRDLPALWPLRRLGSPHLQSEYQTWSSNAGSWLALHPRQLKLWKLIVQSTDRHIASVPAPASEPTFADSLAIEPCSICGISSPA